MSKGLLYITLLLGCLSMLAATQCPTFYTKYNQGGKTFQLCSSANVPQCYDNRASSFIVPAGYSVTLYERSNYTGQTLGPFTQGSYNMPSHFNNQLSSVQVNKLSQGPDAHCATFYTAYNQTGKTFQLCSGDQIPSQYKNQVRSFVVPSGDFIAFYPGAGSNGLNIGIYTQGSYNVPVDIQNKIDYVVILPNGVSYTQSGSQGQNSLN